MPMSEPYIDPASYNAALDDVTAGLLAKITDHTLKTVPVQTIGEVLDSLRKPLPERYAE